MIVMLASFAASAALTPAGTQIRNSATANYTDVNRNPRAEVTSNEVVTIVSTLRGVDITPNPDPVTGVSYAVGTTENKETDYAFTITNTGNAVDTISLSVSGLNLADGWKYRIYWDRDGNGQLDGMEALSTVSGTGALPQGGTYKVIVKVIAPSVQNLNKSDRITLTATSSDGATKDSGVITLDLSSPVVSISKTVRGGPSYPMTYSYLITVKNSDQESAALNVVVEDFLNYALQLAGARSDTATSIIDFPSKGIRWKIPYLAPNSQAQLEIFVSIVGPPPVGYNIQNEAQLWYEDYNRNIYSLTAMSSPVTVPFIPGLELIRITPSTSVVSPGGSANFIFDVKNTGNGMASFQITGLSTEGWMLTDGSSAASTWMPASSMNLNNMAAGEIRTVSLETTVPADAADRSGNSIFVTVTSVTFAEVSGGIGSVFQVAAPDLTLEKSVDKETALPGDVLTYTFRIFNLGSGSAFSAVLVDPIPGNTTYVAGSIRVNGMAQTDEKDADQADFSISNASAITVNMPLIAAGDSVRITFQVSVD